MVERSVWLGGTVGNMSTGSNYKYDRKVQSARLGRGPDGADFDPRQVCISTLI